MKEGVDIKMLTPSQVPAIHMEEVTPITVSDAAQLAPEEIFEKPESLPQGETEKTRTSSAPIIGRRISFQFCNFYMQRRRDINPDEKRKKKERKERQRWKNGKNSGGSRKKAGIRLRKNRKNQKKYRWIEPYNRSRLPTWEGYEIHTKENSEIDYSIFRT
jgi:U3 small nucleolar RNA-associated protein MPP10